MTNEEIFKEIEVLKVKIESLKKSIKPATLPKQLTVHEINQIIANQSKPAVKPPTKKAKATK